jgi:hypothetical protein
LPLLLHCNLRRTRIDTLCATKVCSTSAPVTTATEVTTPKRRRSSIANRIYAQCQSADGRNAYRSALGPFFPLPASGR